MQGRLWLRLLCRTGGPGAGSLPSRGGGAACAAWRGFPRWCRCLHFPGGLVSNCLCRQRCRYGWHKWGGGVCTAPQAQHIFCLFVRAPAMRGQVATKQGRSYQRTHSQ